MDTTHYSFTKNKRPVHTLLLYAQILEHGWSRDTLVAQIQNKAHERQGALVHNFDTTLTNYHSLWAKQTYKGVL